MRRASVAVVAVVWLAGSGVAAVQPSWSAAVDKVFAPWAAKDSPGCAVGVFQQGRIVFEKGYGMADLEHDVPIAPDTVFYAGSVSKQFTAMAAALAIQQGKLSADDPIRTYLPELPAYAGPITVRHLVHHTSGLRDYNTLLSIAGRRGDEAYDNPTVLRMTARQTALNFAPGAEYLYSNTGYTLLASVVERATGMPFGAFTDTYMFRPLGMRATHFGVDASRIVPKRASAYARGANGELRLDTPRNERAGAGGLYTTIRDLLHWDANFYDARVGGPQLIAQVQTTGRLSDGSPLTYAWGLQIGEYRGAAIVEHGGSLGGYRAHLTRFPAQRTSVAALCNLGSIAPSGLVRQVADAALAGRLRAGPARQPQAGTGRGGGREAAVAAPAAATAVDPASLTGEYYSPEIDATFTVTVENGQLMLRRDRDKEAASLQPMADGRFRFRAMSVRFEEGSEGHSAALLVDAGRVRGIRLARVTRSGTQ
jgi:CubicO group peptidase (beta-lactamase class C family)